MKKHDDATADEHDERYDDDNISPLSCSYHPVPVAFVNGFRTPRPRPSPQVRRHAVAVDHLWNCQGISQWLIVGLGPGSLGL